MKVYAVRKGRKPGIYTTWADCQNQVKGFKGAEFKSFNKHSEAYEYIREFKNDEKIVNGVMHEVDLHIYVDGSYDKKTGMCSYAVVILDSERQLIDTITKSFFDTYSSHNVTGEIYGAIAAIQYAYDNNKTAIIYHDYTGIASWYKGEWSIKSEIAQYYDSEIKHMKNHDIYFKKVLGHSGDQYNELADRLAKRELNIIE